MANSGSGRLKIPLLGLLSVKNCIITKQELQNALDECRGADDCESALKKYLLDHELVSPENMKKLIQAAKVFAMRQQDLRFGAIAIKKGFINHSVLKLTLEEQEDDIRHKRKVRLLGELLMEAGMLTSKQCEYILRLQNRKGACLPDHQGTDSEVENAVYDNSGESAEEPDVATLEPEIIDGGLQLAISEDFMAAFLSKTDNFDPSVSVERIKQALLDKGIVQGIADDKMIEGFINSSGFRTKSFRVAKGILPVQGKDAKVEFFFDTDYLKAGGLTVDGTIDFRDRGSVPHVEEDTVLAEKIPAVESRNGRNIFGKEIETVPGNDIMLKLGKGVKFSEDGLKVLAAVSGFPKYSLSGHIFVHSEYVTSGDVDFETGHITYSGNVNVNGRIKSGFKVSGNDIKAVELDGGIIDAQGSVRIENGINEGKIYCRGSIYAKFIHKSSIVCMGDVVIEKEIVDSDVECSGSCVVGGKLISSEISAKMGVRAKNIGSEKAGHNTIQVGHDVFTEKELEKNAARLSEIENQKGLCRQNMEKLSQENLEIQREVSQLAHIQDRSQLEEKDIMAKIASIGDNPEHSSETAELRARIGHLQQVAMKAEQELDAKFDRNEEIENLLAREEEKISALEKKREDLDQEKVNLVKWSKNNPGKPVVIVEGQMMPGTVIFGRHSEKRVGELIRRAKIMETACVDENGRNLGIYEMHTVNL
jgi:uncharacterized protein (DUF342 family)